MALMVVLPAGLSRAQEIIYPALQEPMHKPFFHNEKIDVYDVHLQPGQQTYFHRHSRDQLGISLRSATSRSQVLGAPETESRVVRGSISYIPHSVLGGYTHRVRAVADPTRVIGIEFAAPAPSDAKRMVATPNDAELVFPQGKITRMTVSAGASRRLGGSVIVPVTGGTLKPSNGRAWSFGEGDVRWIGDQPPMTYRNDRATAVELLVLTLND